MCRFQNKESIISTQNPYWYTVYPPGELTQVWTLECVYRQSFSISVTMSQNGQRHWKIYQNIYYPLLIDFNGMTFSLGLFMPRGLCWIMTERRFLTDYVSYTGGKQDEHLCLKVNKSWWKFMWIMQLAC